METMLKFKRLSDLSKVTRFNVKDNIYVRKFFLGREGDCRGTEAVKGRSS